LLVRGLCAIPDEEQALNEKYTKNMTGNYERLAYLPFKKFYSMLQCISAHVFAPSRVAGGATLQKKTLLHSNSDIKEL
jgi:hypothetical protein